MFPLIGSIESTTASIAFRTLTLAVAVSQFAGSAFFSQIWYVMLYVPLGVFAARVTFPLASTLNGPDELTVTVVFPAVTAAPPKVSFDLTLPIFDADDPEDFVPKSSLTATKSFTIFTVTVAELQFPLLAISQIE